MYRAKALTGKSMEGMALVAGNMLFLTIIAKTLALTGLGLSGSGI
jgi:hypothetical protein